MPRRFSREPRSAWGRGRSRSRTRTVRRVQSAGGPMRPARGSYRLTRLSRPPRRSRSRAPRFGRRLGGPPVAGPCSLGLWRQACALRQRTPNLQLMMRRSATVALLSLAAACWLAAGPGGLTLRAVLACQHHHAAAGHAGHHGPAAPSDAPCFCADMTGASDLATVSPAVPAPEPLPAVVAAGVVPLTDAARFPLPPSPAFSPESPPPDPC